MPIYRYRCLDCAQTAEVIKKISDKGPPSECSHCGGTEFTEVLSAPMIVFKGRGWAQDGYHYAKTPADSIPGYSDDHKHTVLPNRPKSTPGATTLPQPVPAPSEDE